MLTFKKKFMVIVVTLFCYSNLFATTAEEKEAVVKSTVGILFDLGLHNNQFDSENYGVSVLFRRQYPQSNQRYWTINARYMHYSDNIKTRKDLSLMLGYEAVALPFSHKPTSLLMGFDLGLLHKMQSSYYIAEHFYESSDKLVFIFGVNSGLIYALSKNINIDWRMGIRFGYGAEIMVLPSLSAGLSYSF